jgi:hypothetical protein
VVMCGMWVRMVTGLLAVGQSDVLLE